MRIRILKKAAGKANGVDLDEYRPGQVYDLGPGLAEYLVAEGLAIVEMRADHTPARKPERRRKPS
jgi:hypothetical protein